MSQNLSSFLQRHEGGALVEQYVGVRYHSGYDDASHGFNLSQCVIVAGVQKVKATVYIDPHLSFTLLLSFSFLCNNFLSQRFQLVQGLLNVGLLSGLAFLGHDMESLHDFLVLHYLFGEGDLRQERIGISLHILSNLFLF